MQDAWNARDARDCNSYYYMHMDFAKGHHPFTVDSSRYVDKMRSSRATRGHSVATATRSSSQHLTTECHVARVAVHALVGKSLAGASQAKQDGTRILSVRVMGIYRPDRHICQF